MALPGHVDKANHLYSPLWLSFMFTSTIFNISLISLGRQLSVDPESSGAVIPPAAKQTRVYCNTVQKMVSGLCTVGF